MIRRRCVYHITGYDPIGANSLHRRFRRELATFAKTWNVAATVSDSISSPETSSAHWTVVAQASNWRVEAVYEPLLWDDIVNADLSRPMATRLAKSALAFHSFVFSGTLFRYICTSWRYSFFFLYPYLYLCAFAVVAFTGAGWAASYLELTGAAWFVTTVAAGVVVFLGLLQWPGRRWRVQQALDDWIFSWDYLYGRRRDLDARLDRFADKLVARAREAAVDEIVVVGHSMGASLAIDVVTRALARDPQLGRHGPTVCVVTVGSTIPKFTLHPAADRLRRCVAQVAAEPSIEWAEYQARHDVISFYSFDPVTGLRLDGERLNSQPIIRRVKLHNMFDARRPWRDRLKFMRLHYQFVMANHKRTVYDYFIMVCGPIPFARWVRAPDGPAELIAPDGTLIDQASLAPATPFFADNTVAPPDNSRADWQVR